MTGLPDVVRMMAEEGSDAIYASMIEMYPTRFTDLDQSGASPKTFAELISVAPYFDAHPLVRLDPDASRPVVIGTSASSRLFRHFAIGHRRRILDPLPLGLRRLLTTDMYSSAVYETPVVNFRLGVDLEDSHRATGASYSSLLLGLLHFKFTPDSLQKVPRIITEQSHSRKSRKYVGYELLFEEMRRSDGSFLGPHSERFEGPHSLSACGLTCG